MLPTQILNHLRVCRLRIGRRLLAISMIGLSASACAQPAPDAGDDRVDERARMVARQIASRDVDDPRVLDAMRAVPRHRFVDPAQAAFAYDDRPLPIGHGQTISQPTSSR